MTALTVATQICNNNIQNLTVQTDNQSQNGLISKLSKCSFRLVTQSIFQEKLK